MKVADFKTDSPGSLIPTVGGVSAFLPDPLPPPTLLSTWDLSQHLSNAQFELGNLLGLVHSLPNPALLTEPFIRREAVLSSRIEGTQASVADLVLFEVADKEVTDVREVANYVRALHYGLERLKKLPISLRLIREIHEELMRGVRGGHAAPGEFRTHQNHIGTPGSPVEDARFVPPPVPQMIQAMGDLEKFIHENKDLPSLIRVALVHYQFEAIHPFADGNGRVGRLLIPLMMWNDGLLTQPVLYISDYLERHRDEYYQRLLAVSQEGDWMGWIRFFLDAVANQSVDTMKRAGDLQKLHERYRAELGASKRTSALLIKLIDRLFLYPAVSVPLAATYLGITRRSAGKHVERLVANKVLEEATGRERNRIFVAPEIIRILSV